MKFSGGKRGHVEQVDTDYLSTFVFDAKTQSWNGPYQIKVSEENNSLISGVTGKPIIFSSDFGNLELMVPQGDTLKFYYRNPFADPDPTVWHKGVIDLQAGIPGFSGALQSAVFFQSHHHWNANGNPPPTFSGNLEVLVHVKGNIHAGSKKTSVDQLNAYYYDYTTQRWQGPNVIIADSQPISGITGTPAYLEDEDGEYHIVAAVAGSLRHYWTRFTNYPSAVWQHGFDPSMPISQTSGYPIADSVSMFISPNINENAPNDFLLMKLLVHLKDQIRIISKPGQSIEGFNSHIDYLVTYAFGAGWNSQGVITVAGKSVEGVSPF